MLNIGKYIIQYKQMRCTFLDFGKHYFMFSIRNEKVLQKQPNKYYFNIKVHLLSC